MKDVKGQNLTNNPKYNDALFKAGIQLRSGPKIIKLFSCSTQMIMKFQLLIPTKMLLKIFLAFNLTNVVFILLINVKMPTIVGILTFMSVINFKLS